MTKSKVNYDKFASFDLNEACDYFDCTDQRAWKKIGKFIVADGQEYVEVMENHFDFEDTAEGEYAAFDAGVRYALTKMNIALEAAGIDVQICETDLVEAMGFVMVRCDDEPEDFVKRALKKPVLQVESWV
jgi:hypothetical protein